MHKGILPTILENLLAARGRAKKQMKAATDPFERAVYDGKQASVGLGDGASCLLTHTHTHVPLAVSPQDLRQLGLWYAHALPKILHRIL